MNKATSWISSLLILSCILFSQGCATLVKSKKQKIPVTSSPIGATVMINGMKQGTTPLEIRAERKRKDQVIRIESPGYNPVEIQVKRSSDAMTVLGNVVLGAPIGLAAAILVGIVAGEEFFEDDPSPSRTALFFTIPAAIIGFGLIDRGSGKKYTLTPTDINVTLTKIEGTPHVDTLFIDAADFQNVKWIRVHRD